MAMVEAANESETMAISQALEHSGDGGATTSRAVASNRQRHRVAGHSSNLLSAAVALMTTRVHCSHALLGSRFCLRCKRHPYRGAEVEASFVRGTGGRAHYRWHNEGNAAAKLVSDTDCGGIDSNEPLGDALNVSLVNPLFAQPRNAKTTLPRRMDFRRTDLYTCLSSPLAFPLLSLSFSSRVPIVSVRRSNDFHLFTVIRYFLICRAKLFPIFAKSFLACSSVFYSVLDFT